MPYNHGVTVLEQPTPITPVKQADTALPFVVGTASGTGLVSGTNLPVNEIKLIFSYQEYCQTFGWNGDLETYTLEQFAYIYFKLYAVCPVLFVNVYNPAAHIKIEDVQTADIAGGVDAATGKRFGLELIEEVFPRFGKIPCQILCPGFSHETSLYPLMLAKAEKNNSFFKSMTYIDLQGTTIANLLAEKGAIDSPYAAACTSPVIVGGQKNFLASHMAGSIAKLDAQNGSAYESPSNKALTITGVGTNFSIEEANTLNGSGIVTYFRFTGGWKLWGSRTSAYPGTTDIKDAFIPNRRMANWLNNTLIIDTWNKVDDPMNKRLIDSIVTKWNIFLNGQVARGFLIGAKISFLEDDNPVTDLADGIITFRIDYLAPPPARNIQFLVTVDVAYFNSLF